MTRVILIGLALGLSACATAPSQAPNTASNAQQAPCITASRLSQSNCVAGSSHSGQELNSTGQASTNLATSLRMVDPTVH